MATKGKNPDDTAEATDGDATTDRRYKHMKANLYRSAVSRADWDRVTAARAELNFLQSLENEEICQEDANNYLFNAAIAETIEEYMSWMDCHYYVLEVQEV